MPSLENDVERTDASVGFCVPKETNTENVYTATGCPNQALTRLLIVLSKKQDTLYH